MNKNYKILSAVMLFALIAIAGCTTSTTQNTQTTKEETIKVGLLAPLTGEAASFGVTSLAGAELAVKEINEQGGINGKKVVLVVEDDTCTPKATNAIQKLINIDNVDIIVGPFCSAAAGPALPIATQSNMPVVLSGASAPGLTAIGDNVFRVYMSDAYQGKAGAEFALNELNAKKAAVLYTQNDWGEGLRQVFIETYEAKGGEIVFEGGAPQSQTDLRTELSRIKNSDAEVIYMILYPNSAISALKQMQELDIELQVLSGDAFVAEEVLKSGYSEGAIFSIQKSEISKEFDAKINAMKGYETLEINIGAPYTYDAMFAAFDAIDRAETTSHEDVIAALEKTSMSGVTNEKIEFDEEGDLKNVAIDFVIIKDKDYESYK